MSEFGEVTASTEAVRPAGPDETTAADEITATTEPSGASGPAPDAAGPSATLPAPAPTRSAWRRTGGRWGAAVLVFALFTSGVAYGVTRAERGDVPGLATESDGRWDYPRLKLPPLPSGSPRPFAKGNPARIHHADIRDLLLPAPEGASADTSGKTLPGLDGGWVSHDVFLAAFQKSERTYLGQVLRDYAPGHIAARSWKMPDGTRTRIYLARFNTGAYPEDFYQEALVGQMPPGAGDTPAVDKGWPKDAEVPHITRHAFTEEAPRGKTHVRHAYLLAGDTLALIVQSRPGTAPKVPFQQTVILQSQLLG